MKTVTSNDIGPELLKFFGVLADNCYKATITLQAGEAVEIEAHYWGAIVESKTKPGERIAETITRRFSVVEITE